MKTKSKILMQGFLAFGSASAIMPLVACQTTKEQTTLEQTNNIIDYDLGLASEPINNLNYVLRNSMNKVTPALVEVFLKNGPNEDLKSLLVPQKYNFVLVDTRRSKDSSNFDAFFNSTKKNPNDPNSTSSLNSEGGFGNVQGSSYGLHDFSIYGGLGKNSVGDDVKKGASVYAFHNPKNTNNYMAVTGFVNEGKNVWSNGDIVSAQDIRDYIEYILDYNNGSEKFDQIKKMAFRNAEEFINAQVEYNKQHGKFYKNPWGRHEYITKKDEFLVSHAKELVKLGFNDASFSNFASKFETYFSTENDENFSALVKAYSNIYKESLTNAANFLTSLVATEETKDLVESLSKQFNSLVGYVQNPYASVWDSQKEDQSDLEQVNNIKEAALKFGLYTGQYFLDYSNEEVSNSLELNPNFSLDKKIQPFKLLNKNGTVVEIMLVKNVFVNPYQTFSVTKNNVTELPSSLETSARQLSYNKYGFTAIFNENKTPDLSFLLTHVLMQLFPINRKYVETEAGGILNYGINKDNFLTTGPFLLDKERFILGPQGYMYLLKNKDYYNVDNVIPNTIKILFTTDPNINTIFFEDNIISQAQVPGTKINQFWSSATTRKYLKKNTGYGTIGLGFNLDKESNGNSYIQDQNIRNAIYYALNREEMLRYVGWEFSFPVNIWTAFGQYKTFDGRNLEMFFNNKETGTLVPDPKAPNKFVSYPLINYDFLLHLAKSYNFEKTVRHDNLYDLNTAKFYLNQFKKSHPNVQGITLRYLNNSSDEQRKAGLFLKEKIEYMSGGFIQVEIKSLPDQVFASFYEEGQFDFVYQNYDKIGGNAPQDYISAFFRRDGLNQIDGITFGFKDNPSGGFIYADYFVKLLVDKLYGGSYENATKTQVDAIRNIINQNAELNSQFEKAIAAQKQNENDLVAIVTFVNKNINFILGELKKDKNNYASEQMAKNLLYYLIAKNPNIKRAKLEQATVNIFVDKYTLEDFLTHTSETRARLIEPNIKINKQDANGNTEAKELDLWSKAIDLSLQKNDESVQQYSDRLSSFFSGNFTTEEAKQGWAQDYIYSLIGTFEKILRDAAPVAPLMEVDTNWEVSKVGGVSSLYTFDLQYAYDITRPPRPGLPTNIGNGVG
ncbi:hypothetical protein ACJA23_02295 [Mycoplasma corogypsi]|uniref:hypothetical protein n=1 Tax=Mycoplasma corogypsi TaxID=2106 RepID=UPI00387361BE